MTLLPIPPVKATPSPPDPPRPRRPAATPGGSRAGSPPPPPPPPPLHTDGPRPPRAPLSRSGPPLSSLNAPCATAARLRAEPVAQAQFRVAQRVPQITAVGLAADRRDLCPEAGEAHESRIGTVTWAAAADS